MSNTVPTTAAAAELERLTLLCDETTSTFATVAEKQPNNPLAHAAFKLGTVVQDLLALAKQEHYAGQLHEQLGRTISSLLEERTELLAKIRELEGQP